MIPVKQAPPESNKYRSFISGGSVFFRKGIPVGMYLLITMSLGFIIVCGTFAFLALKYIPDIINNQIEMRTQAIATSFSGAITKPLLLKNYLQVNQEAQRTSKLPGVAYAAVVNTKNIAIGGFFSDLSRFDEQFAKKVKEKGFPGDILNANKLPSQKQEANARILVGGQLIYDKVLAIADAGGAVHIGIYISEVDNAIHEALFSPLTLSLIGIVLLFGLGIFILLTRSITKPLQEVTNVINRVSVGEMDLTIAPKGPREIRELAAAFERMHQSIKYIISQLDK